MSKIIDASGALTEVKLDLTVYKEAEEKGMSVRQLVNQKYPTSEAHGSAFNQILASDGVFLGSDAANGIRASTFGDVYNGNSMLDASSVVRDSVPTSRIIFPAAIMAAMEDKLLTDLDMTAGALEQMIAIDETIPGTRFERPVLNFTKPESARSNGVSQLAPPNTMLTVTVSDVARTIPTFALGMEISEQATKNVSLDLITFGLARQAAVERAERADNYLSSLLFGDLDSGDVALSAIAGKTVNAATLDSTLSTAGNLSQKAWMAWLIKNGRKRRITHVVTDLAGALAIENRANKPNVMTDNPNSPRINTLGTVMNPTWANEVKIYITEDTNWPANTIMGIDSRFAIARVKSISAQYQAIEEFALRRGSGMRFDFGEIVYRFQSEAFEVLTLM